jgi:hypothetical protein
MSSHFFSHGWFVACDKINHNILLDCLQNWFGFSRTVLNWFLYLTDRTQMVNIGDFVSEKFNIHFGVPQDSVLGVILFYLYTCSLCYIIKSYTSSNIWYHFYADDTKIYCRLSPFGEPSDLNTLQKWYSKVHE